MIKRVHIRGYKSLRDLNLELKPLTVIFGPNATGKSNFFDALYLLSKIVTSRNLAEAFEGHRGLPFEAFYAPEGVVESPERGDLELTFEVDVAISDSVVEEIHRVIAEKRKRLPPTGKQKSEPKGRVTEKHLRYTITIGFDPKTLQLFVKHERLKALYKNWKKEKARKPFIDTVRDTIFLRMEGEGHPFHYEVGLDYPVVAAGLYEPHYPHISALREELKRWAFYYLEPRAMMRGASRMTGVKVLPPTGKDLPSFLNTLREENEQQFANLGYTLKNLIPSIDTIKVERKEGLFHLYIYEGGSKYSARLISEGTLRGIGLLSILNPVSPISVIGIEEPENGIHPRRLKTVADLINNASKENELQIIINTHSPLLPRYFDYENLYVCTRKGSDTKIVPFFVTKPLYAQKEVESVLDETEFGKWLIRGDLDG